MLSEASSCTECIKLDRHHMNLYGQMVQWIRSNTPWQLWIVIKTKRDYIDCSPTKINFFMSLCSSDTLLLKSCWWELKVCAWWIKQTQLGHKVIKPNLVGSGTVVNVISMLFDLLLLFNEGRVQGTCPPGSTANLKQPRNIREKRLSPFILPAVGKAEYYSSRVDTENQYFNQQPENNVSVPNSGFTDDDVVLLSLQFWSGLWR